MIIGLSKDKIELLFEALNTELQQEDTKGELYLMGGAVMCLVYDTRASTHDVDALFKPSKKVREAAARAALKLGIDERWLNDGVKGFISAAGSFTSCLIESPKSYGGTS